MATDSTDGTAADAAAAAFDLSQLDLVHVPDKRRFEARLGDKVVSIAAYADTGTTGSQNAPSAEDTEPAGTDTSAGAVRDFNHTVTQPAYGGNGIAAHLVRWALDESIAEGYKIFPGCSFVKHFIEANPEYADHLG